MTFGKNDRRIELQNNCFSSPKSHLICIISLHLIEAWSKGVNNNFPSSFYGNNYERNLFCTESLLKFLRGSIFTLLYYIFI